MKMHITERALAQYTLPAHKKKELIFDTEQSGFAVVVTSAGAMTYSIVYKDEHGKQRQEKLAKVGDISANAARSLAKNRLQDMAQQRKTAPASNRAMNPHMDDFFFKKYLPHVKNSSRSHEVHASLYRNHLQASFGHKRLDEITEDDVVELNTQLRNKAPALGRWPKLQGKILAEGTVKRILILLRHIFNVTVRDKGVPLQTNPTHALRLTTVRKVRGRFLGKEQLKALFKAASSSENPDFADIVRVMGATGLRRSNVLAMQWSWLDGLRGTLTIPPEADKAKRGYVLHLAADVEQLLAERRKRIEGAWVFPNPKTGKPYSSCRAAWVHCTQKAKLEGLRMHDLRHTYASMMLDSGADIIGVQQALGHTQLKTTSVYLHLTDGKKRQYANAAVAATGLF